MAILAMTALHCVGCAHRGEPTAEEVPSITFRNFGLEIEFDEPVALDHVRVERSDGAVVQRLATAGIRRRFELPFHWEAGQDYEVELNGARYSRSVPLHAPSRPALEAYVEYPAGQGHLALGGDVTIGQLVPPSGETTLGLFVENQQQAEAEFVWRLEPGQGVVLESDDPGWRRDGTAIEMSGRLPLEFDYHHALVRVRCDAPLGSLTCRLTTSADVAAADVPATNDAATNEPAGDVSQRVSHLTLQLRRATVDELSDIVEAEDVVFPADPLGRPRPEQLADAVVLPGRFWSWLRSALRPGSMLFNAYEPYAYQSLRLGNRSDVALNLLIESEVTVAGSDAPLLAFAPPEWKSPNASLTSQFQLRINQHESAAAEMPLYVRADVEPGHYERRFRVFLLGQSEPLLSLSRPLVVRRGNAAVSSVVLVSIVACLGAWIAAFAGRRRLLSHMNNEALATVAMIGGLHFAVSYASRIATDVVAAATGPFAIFLAGIGNEGLTSMLLAALVTLVPRPGTLTLSNLTVFLLNAMFTGQFGLADVLFVTVSIVLGEGALAALGVTTGRAFRRPGATATPNLAVRMGLAIGLANAATLYVQFCLIQVLHRLYFATWYVASVALLTGLIYGALGAGWGTGVGFQLRRVAR